jgi:4-amino-4-deoxy-L-arabinose transferase-like glycosyltransferase
VAPTELRLRLPRLPFRVVVAIVLALAGALRFATLPARGFWGDELSTVFLAHDRFGAMLHSVSQLESTPPLYYSLAWAWAKIFGTTETGIRSLSALFGLATVPVVYAAARELVSRRPALVAAALVAVNPLLVWYSQEARSYALLAFLGAAGLYFFARALRGARGRDLAGWALTSSLALMTHYFAAFIVIAEAIALARGRPRGRSLLMALAAVGGTGALLLPLMLHQRSRGHADWISHSSPLARAVTVPAQFIFGFDAPLPVVVGIVGTLLALAGALAAVRGASGRDRRGAGIATALALGAIAMPLCLAFVGFDYFNTRNAIVALVPATIALAVGYAAASRGARIAGALLGIASVAVVLATAEQPKFRSEGWRAAAQDLGRVPWPRALVAAPGQAGRKPLEYYTGAKRVSPAGRVVAREIDVVALPQQGRPSVPHVQVSRLLALRLPGFRLAWFHRESDFALVSFRAPRPLAVSAAMLARNVRWGGPAVLSQPAARLVLTSAAR